MGGPDEIFSRHWRVQYKFFWLPQPGGIGGALPRDWSTEQKSEASHEDSIASALVVGAMVGALAALAVARLRARHG